MLEDPSKKHNCCNQAITRFDRWSVSDIAMFQQLRFAYSAPLIWFRQSNHWNGRSQNTGK